MELSRHYPDTFVRRAYLLLFVLSGFSGLIYESIWTHYLKLFLGHAAYAQTLVLAIFMGGMALGAWLASRWTLRLRHPLLAYAATEAIIGLLALVFHPLFVHATGWSYDRVIPALGSPVMVEVWKWGLGGMLIFPQSVLLGATFPFVSAGLVRRIAQEPGRLVAGLYFANSLGAAAGILVAGFVLISRVGLPGTIATAGFINLALALGVYVLVRSDSHAAAPVQAVTPAPVGAIPVPVRILLWVSLLTGLASFFYEIGWIRMLSLVLGSSTHAFELMLSAFITGIAIGGFWVRRRVDGFRYPLQALAGVQLAMGTLAAATLLGYDYTFLAMQDALQALSENDAGYLWFNLFSHGLALLVMLPATICAGMTLPIITFLLLTRGEGEAAIGRVYAVNTIGAIAGVFLAVQCILPWLGLKALIALGAALDVALGIGLLWLDRGALTPLRRRAWPVLAASWVLAVVWLAPWDLNKMASGVFRSGVLLDAAEKVIYHHDGKTATVDVVRHPSFLSIRTNGKVDAAVLLQANSASPDESTMTLLAAIPMMVNPAMRDAAVIGMGSGMSSHTLLLHPGLRRVDTIEIEPGMIAGARLFGDKVARTFNDPRSHIHVADAKTYLTSQQQAWDLILSEPSNPWVSGVAGLFSVEFYSLVSRHLASNGMLAQWFHLYEIDMPLVASVAKAMEAVFPHVQLYGTGQGDVLFLASQQPIPAARFDHLQGAAIRQALARVGISSQADVDWTYLGSRASWQPLFDSYDVPANSDYFPYLDQHAVRARYLNERAIDLQMLYAEAFAALEARQPDRENLVNPGHPLQPGQSAAQARLALQYWRSLQYGEQMTGGQSWSAHYIAVIQALRQPLHDCDLVAARNFWLPAVVEFANRVQPYWPEKDLQALWDVLLTSPCLQQWPAWYVNWVHLLKASASHDPAGVLAAARNVLPLQDTLADSPENRLLLKEILVAHIRRGEYDQAVAAWQRYEHRFDAPLYLRALSAYAIMKSLGG